jgi:hypothetical protein
MALLAWPDPNNGSSQPQARTSPSVSPKCTHTSTRTKTFTHIKNSASTPTLSNNPGSSPIVRQNHWTSIRDRRITLLKNDKSTLVRKTTPRQSKRPLLGNCPYPTTNPGTPNQRPPKSSRGDMARQAATKNPKQDINPSKNRHGSHAHSTTDLTQCSTGTRQVFN